MRRVTALVSACVAVMCVVSAYAPAYAERSSGSAEAALPTRLLITRPVEVTTEKAPQYTWIMGLVDAYMRVRFTGRDDFSVITYEDVLARIPKYNAVNRPIQESVYFDAAKPLRADMVLFQKYEYVSKEEKLQFYVELIAVKDRRVVASFEKVIQVRTLPVELDDAVLRLCEKVTATPSARSVAFFDKYIISTDPGRQKAFGQTVALEFYSSAPDYPKIAKRYSELARENTDMQICYWMAGRTYVRMKEYKAALEMYRGFREAFPRHGPVHEALCEAYRFNGENDRAVDMAKSARAQGYEPTTILVEQLRGLEALGRKDEAYAVALEVLERDPGDPFALFFVARWRVSEGRFEEGLELADRLLEQDPNHGGAMLEKGRALVGLKKSADAVMPLTQATVLLPKDAAPHIELGQIFRERKDYAKAAGHFAEACKYRQDDLELFLTAADAYEQAKQLKEAAKLLYTIEPKSPDDLRLNAKLGLLEYGFGDTAKARLHLEKRIKSRVDDSLIFLALGDIYNSDQEYMKAINVFEQAIPLVKDKNRIRIQLGQLFLKKKEPSNALPYFEQIAEESPSYPTLYRWFGDAYREAQVLDKAIESYKKERKAQGDDPYLQEQIASLYFRQNNYKEAETECLRLAKVDPKNANAYYRLSIIALSNKNASQAENYLTKAMRLGDADEETYYRLGVGYAAVGRYEAAEKAYRKCIEQNGKRYEAWSGLAGVQLKAGKDSIAAETYMALARFDREEYREASSTAGKLFEKLRLAEKAREAYNWYLGHKNMSEDVNLRLARIEYANGNYETVHRLLGNPAMIGELSEADNMLLAESYMKLKWYKEALPLLERAIVAKPDFKHAIELAAEASWAIGEVRKTMEMCRRYVALPPTPEHPKYAYRIAELLLKLKDPKAAKAQYEANIKAYPDDIRNYEKLASLCTSMKDWDCAMEALEKAAKLPVATAAIKQMLAALYERLGMQEKASAQYQQYLSDAPQDSSALLAAGTLAYTRREYGRAVELLSKAHGLMPQNFESAFMLGDSYMRQGKTNEAVEAFLEARRIRSTDRDVLASLAKCYANLNDTRNLVPMLREWMFVEPANMDVKAQLGRVLLEQHNTSEAARLLETVSRERPADVDIHRQLAKVYEQTGDEEGFIRHIKEALTHADLKADLYYDLGRYYLRKKRRDLALEYIAKAVEADKTLTAAHYEYAQLLRESGNTRPAYEAAQRCVELDPYNTKYLTLFSQIAYQMAKPEIAMDAILRAIDSDSSDVAALSWAGFLHYEKREASEARPFLERALRLDANCALCQEYMGDVQLYEGNYEEAASHYEKSLAVRAYSEHTSLKLAKAVLLSGQPEKAGLLFEKILNMNRQNDEAVYWLSHVYVLLGRAAEAQNLPRSYKFTTKTAWLHLAQGEIYEAQDNVNAALISFSVAARLMPDEPRTLAATGRMHLAKREYENAVEYFGKALGQDPHNPQYLLELGKAYEGLTDYNSAIQIYEEVVRTNPQLTDAYYWASRSLSKSGEHLKAIEMLKKAIQRKPSDMNMRMAIGHEYRAASQFQKAIDTYEAVGKEGGPQYVDGYRFAGMVYYENLKDQGRARKLFERFVKSGGSDPQVQDLMAKMQ